MEISEIPQRVWDTKLKHRLYGISIVQEHGCLVHFDGRWEVKPGGSIAEFERGGDWRSID